MARKKNVPVEPELSGPDTGTSGQLPDEEAIATQEAALTGETANGKSPNETPPLDGETAAGEGMVPGGELQLDGEAASGGASDGETWPNGADLYGGDVASSDGVPAAGETAPPLEGASDTAEEGMTFPAQLPEGIAEESAVGEEPHSNPAGGEAEPQYQELLKEMQDTKPVPEDGANAPEDQGGSPLLLEGPGAVPEMSSEGENPVEFPAAEERPNPGSPLTGRPARPRRAPAQRNDYVLTIDARDRVQTEEERAEIIWHEIRNAYRTRRILTGILGGVKQTNSGRTLAVVDYKGFRVAIPIMEMMLYTGEMPANREYLELMGRLNRTLSTMLGAEIDFIIKGIGSNTHSIVASRKDAMLRRRKTFYMDTDELGEHMIFEGRVVQARVIAVAEKVIRVEAFGVECAIVARDLSWEWLDDARDFFSVDSRILVRVLTIDRSSLEGLSITADVRSVSTTTNLDNVKKCQP